MNRLIASLLLLVLLTTTACQHPSAEPKPVAAEPVVSALRTLFLDRQQEALANQEIVVFIPRESAKIGAERRSIRTDAEGYAETIDHLGARYFARHAEDLVPMVAVPDSSASPTLSLRRFMETGESRVIEILVQDESGRPLAFQAQRQLADGSPLQADWQSSTAAGSLRFDFSWTDSPAALEIRARGMAPRRLLVPTRLARASTASNATKLILKRVLSAETFITDAATGQRISDVEVAIRPYVATDDDALQELSSQLRPTENGIIPLQLAARQVFWIEVKAAGYQTWTSPQAEIESLNVQLIPEP